MRSTLPLLVLALIVACTSEPDGTPGTQTIPATTATPKAPADERDAWQRPEELIAMMGPDLKGMTIADLFAGDGYFTFRLIAAGANVIAIDNDPSNIARLEEQKKAMGLGDDRLKIRAVPVGDPGLAPGEADMALLVHRYTSIRDRGSYIMRLRQGLRSPRPLFLVDWQYRETPVGPPVSERMPSDNLMEELGAFGFSDVGAHSARLPYQVVFIASDYIEMDDAAYQQMMDGAEIIPQ